MERDLVLRGLAANPAVPAEVLEQLLRDWPGPVSAGLSERPGLNVTLQERMAEHPDVSVRRALAGHEPLDPAVRERLLDDPDWSVRASVAKRKHHPGLSGEAVTRLLTDLLDPPELVRRLYYDHELFDEFFLTDWTRVRVAVRHPDRRVRLRAIGSASLDDLRLLCDDADAEVATAAVAQLAEQQRLMEPADLPAEHCHALWWVLQKPPSRALAEQVIASDDVEAVRAFTLNSSIPPDLVDVLSRHGDTEVRAWVAGRDDLTAEQVQRLAGDAEAAVRAAVATREGLPADLVAVLAADPDAGVRKAVATYAYVSAEGRKILAGTADLDPGRAVRWARSANPRLRRRAAQCPDLPGDLVTVLADDQDPSVRLALAEHHPAAPADLLAQCFAEHRSRSGLLDRPQFPTTGLARFAHDANPELRRVAARDPEADPALIARLTTDPEERVRRAAARCPRLPTDRILDLLDHPELAKDAAANPALPWRTVLDRL